LSEIAKSEKKNKTIDKSDLNLIEGFKQFNADDNENTAQNNKDKPNKDQSRFDNPS